MSGDALDQYDLSGDEQAQFSEGSGQHVVDCAVSHVAGLSSAKGASTGKSNQLHQKSRPPTPMQMTASSPTIATRISSTYQTRIMPLQRTALQKLKTARMSGSNDAPILGRRGWSAHSTPDTPRRACSPDPRSRHRGT